MKPSSEGDAARPSKGTLRESKSERRNGPQRLHAGSSPGQRRRQRARQSYERYLAVGREAQVAGDEVEMERCYQFAEHYFRVMRAAKCPWPGRKGYKSCQSQGQSSYKTHILIGVRANGVMTVIADLAAPAAPGGGAEKELDAARDDYTTFALCTPTSIMRADGNGTGKGGWHHGQSTRHSLSRRTTGTMPK